MHHELAKAALEEPSTSGQVMIKIGALLSYFFLGVEWVDDHSGLFVAVGAMISTGIAIRGGLMDRKDKQEKRNIRSRFKRRRD